MKKNRIRTSLALVACATSFALVSPAAESPAGLVDFGKFTPPASGGQFVEVNIKGNLLAMAAKLVGREEPDVAELIRGVQGVRVNVVGLDDGNREEVKERLGRVRGELEARGWERVVTAKSGTEDVAVYLKTRGEEAVEGIAVTVLEGEREAVFVNIVGDIRPDKLAELGERLGIEPLKEAGFKTRKANN